MTKITEILSQKIAENSEIIQKFFANKFAENPPLFYNSVDLRHSGFKIAPVDTNCFPAGFNNLSKISKEKAKIIADNFLNKNFPEAKKILIIPENHTRNFRYLENVLNLQEILEVFTFVTPANAGVNLPKECDPVIRRGDKEVRDENGQENFNHVFAQKREVLVGTLVEDFAQKTVIDLENGRFITLHPLQKKDGKISTIDGFEADLVILNNDLTNGIPEILQNLKNPIVPSPNMGWHARTKSNHFTIYNQLAEELARLIDIDPWLISSMHSWCDNIDFKEQKGLKYLANAVDELIAKLRKKYQEYGIEEEPYCYIKADNGTYGIAVWPVFSGAEVLEINKKERNKMNMLKGAVQNTKVMIQEGIKTIDKIDGKIAEPMIYLIGGFVAGDLFRTNENRDEKISLNAAGASFFDLENLAENQIFLGANKNSISTIYSTISKLAALAAAVENKQI